MLEPIAAYQGGDLTVDALPEEVHAAVLYHGPVVYLCAKDFAVLHRNPPKDAELEMVSHKAALMLGHFATVTASKHSTRVFVSREVPQGYFLSLEEPDPALNWRSTKSERELPPPLESWQYWSSMQPLRLD